MRDPDPAGGTGDHAPTDPGNPDHGGPDQSGPDQSGPDQSTPDHGNPDHSTPDHDTTAPAHDPAYVQAGHDLAERTHTHLVELDSGTKGNWTHELYHKNVEANTTYSIDGGKYLFQTDEHARVVHAEGHLHTVVDAADRARHNGQQVKAGGVDRQWFDDGGHFFGTVFGGPGEGVNITAQWSHLNRGSFRDLESSWADTIDEGGAVHVEIDVKYPGESLRPEAYTVYHQVDGTPEWIRTPFDNGPPAK
ncbi:hypothetical protein GCM10025867_25660 [Frondihabitans sucicola]|uniref:Type VII secretion system protein EssD-like domain-containing protein n=1 Tax=Frondihabitans sucicola TaxID=1268041 RepID=A0ABM8GPE8_9MICO|nr:DNA/RNA non-specific endonuclease [Frondihabitans sucicola]BDZ50325.1 hypothetical protein GCM10025867_25660 [Frondihabitans sucicola]